MRMAPICDEHLKVLADASSTSPAGKRAPSQTQATLISEITLRSTQAPAEMALKLAGMDVSDDAMLGALKSVGLQYHADCVLLTVESARVTCAALWGQPFKYEESEDLSAPRLFRTIRRGMPVIIDDVTQDPTILKEVALGSTVRGYVSTPVRVYGQYVGGVVMTFSEPQQLTVNHLRDFQMAASNIGELLETRLESATKQHQLHAMPWCTLKQ